MHLKSACQINNQYCGIPLILFSCWEIYKETCRREEWFLSMITPVPGTNRKHSWYVWWVCPAPLVHRSCLTWYQNIKTWNEGGGGACLVGHPVHESHQGICSQWCLRLWAGSMGAIYLRDAKDFGLCKSVWALKSLEKQELRRAPMYPLIYRKWEQIQLTEGCVDDA